MVNSADADADAYAECSYCLEKQLCFIIFHKAVAFGCSRYTVQFSFPNSNVARLFSCLDYDFDIFFYTILEKRAVTLTITVPIFFFPQLHTN